MLKWLLISFGVIIGIIAALAGTLYYMIFVKDVALARPITYESEEAAVASGLSDMLDGLLGIELSTTQETELTAIITGIKAGTHEFEDLITFLADDTTGIIFNSEYHITGQRSLQLDETQLTALANLMLSSIDAFIDVPDEFSSAEGALTYTVEGLGDIKLSGFGLNINDEDIAIVMSVTLPQDIPYVGFLFGGKTISIGLNTPYTVTADGTVTFTMDPAGLKVGGISASWPGVSYLTNYIKNSFMEGEPLEFIFNVVEPLNSALGSGNLGLSFAVTEGKMSFNGPAPKPRRAIDYGGSTQEQVATDAKDKIAAFVPGDPLVLSEAEMTALLADSVEDALADSDIGLNTDDLVVNVDEGGGLSLTTTMVVPPGADLPIPAGSEADVDIETEIVIDEEGNATLVISDISLGGLSSSDLGFDVSEMNDAMADAGVDLATALGLPPGSLSSLSTESGSLTLT
ncbi:hypothetical protein ACFLVR_03635 [Chloroflexota bacterium]